MEITGAAIAKLAFDEFVKSGAGEAAKQAIRGSFELEDRPTALALEYTDSTYPIAMMWLFTLKLAEFVYPHSQDLKSLFPSPCNVDT
ncbi:hypothetical protein LEP3755_28100 [Leptolyngbya sp. NIES-3755]|nr:hypothetical protein LEP3755_28100 [Leptolyngbya sp. NIES-3755]